MMAFNSGFVVAILTNDGKTIREQNINNSRVARLKYESEYKIRIWNKSDKRAYAQVTIDGTDVLGGGQLVLGPKEKIDLERFVVDGDLSKGKKFKFVPLSNTDVQDPTAQENGDVVVTFYPELYSTLSYSAPDFSGILRGTTFGSSAGGHVYSAHINSSLEGSKTITTNSIGNLIDTSIAQGKGATVEGGDSSQGFRSSSESFLTGTPVSIRVSIRAPIEMIEAQNVPCWQVCNSPSGVLVRVNGVELKKIEAVEFTSTHMVMKIPVSLVSFANV